MRTTRIVATLALAGLLLLAAPAAFAQDPADAPIRVVVSIPPIKYFVETIAGDYADVYVLVKPGQGPHSYEPTPRDVAALKEAKVFFRAGMPFETVLIDKVRAVAPDLHVVDIAGAPDDSNAEDAPAAAAPAGRSHAGHAHAEHGHAEDAHVWLDPIEGKSIAHVVAHAMRDVDPEHYAHFCSRAHKLMEALDETDRQIRAQLAPYAGRSFLIYHPALGHFAERYGLVQLAIESEGKEPGPRGLAELIDRAKAEKIRTVFVEKQFPQTSARAVVDAIGAEMATIDPLSEDYVENLKAIGSALAAALARP